jgi:hypothetical protein
LNRYAPTNAGDETKVIVKRLRLINKGKMRANFYNAEKLLSYPENADDSLPPRKRFSYIWIEHEVKFPHLTA